MLKRTNALRIIAIAAALVASSALAGTALAREDAPRWPQDKLAPAQDQVNQSVLNLGTYKNGKDSKLDVKVVGQPDSRQRTYASYGK